MAVDARQSMRSVVIAGGGTGGHVFPGLALAQELLRRQPRREVQWIGACGGLEERLVPRERIPLLTLRMAGAARLGLLMKVRAVALAGWATLRLFARFLARRPALLIGVGGFASGPAVLAALLLGVPTMLLEQNAVPGATNRLLSRFVRVTAASFDASKKQLRGKVEVTGNPVRSEISAIPPFDSKSVRRVLGFGGSRGARSINRAWVEGVAHLTDLPVEFFLQTGSADKQVVEDAVIASGLKATVVEFIDDLPREMARADLLVCRAGATTVAEITAAGRAAVLIPYPFAAHDHQRANARSLAERDAAVIIDPDDLNGKVLADTLRELVGDPERVGRLAANARSLGRADATERVADVAESLISGSRLEVSAA